MIVVLRTVIVTVDTSLSIVSRFLPEVRCSRNDDLDTFYDKGHFQAALLDKSNRENHTDWRAAKGHFFSLLLVLCLPYRRSRCILSCSKEVQATLFNVSRSKLLFRQGGMIVVYCVLLRITFVTFEGFYGGMPFMQFERCVFEDLDCFCLLFSHFGRGCSSCHQIVDVKPFLEFFYEMWMPLFP